MAIKRRPLGLNQGRLFDGLMEIALVGHLSIADSRLPSEAFLRSTLLHGRYDVTTLATRLAFLASNMLGDVVHML